MACKVCGRDVEPDREPGYRADDLCPKCAALGFEIGTKGEVICPECGEDFRQCACSAPEWTWFERAERMPMVSSWRRRRG